MAPAGGESACMAGHKPLVEARAIAHTGAVRGFASVATDARLVVLDPKTWETRVPKIQLGLILMSAAVALTEMNPLEALRAAAAGRFEGENLKAIEAGAGLAG